jgi:PD-(D/E)XK nuclease superfamily protein
MEGDRWAALDTNQKGAIAEAEVCCAAAWAGVSVYRPTTDHCRADLLFDLGGRVARVQCKWGRYEDGVIKVRLSTCRLSPTKGYVRSTYSPDEIDAVAAYCPAFDTTYLLPISLVSGRREIFLRVDPARNNQQVGLKWARDYVFPGAIAQLGERVTGSHEAAGSSPASSTQLRLEK